MMAGVGMGFGVVGLFFMILFWGVLILLAVWLVKTLFNSSSQSQPPQSGQREDAGEILERRYARGEITRDQYKMMREDIN